MQSHFLVDFFLFCSNFSLSSAHHKGVLRSGQRRAVLDRNRARDFESCHGLAEPGPISVIFFPYIRAAQPLVYVNHTLVD
jgi:hypothetical protein